MTQQNIAPTMVLSPHFDDAALSMGGIIHQRSRSGSAVTVVNVFAASPTHLKKFSPLAKRLHESWSNGQNPVPRRVLEDEKALRCLKAKSINLNFFDAIYREAGGEFFYADMATLLGSPHPQDVQHVTEIAQAFESQVHAQLNLSSKSSAEVFAPLAIGNHVDHQIVSGVGEALKAKGWKVRFYEDYPYSDPILYPNRQKREKENRESELVILSDADLEAKTAAVSQYASQLSLLFGPGQNLGDLLRIHAQRIGGSRPAERIWR
jgi:LmbE family N-acetylglucosaminyl deacetylase